MHITTPVNSNRRIQFLLNMVSILLFSALLLAVLTTKSFDREQNVVLYLSIAVFSIPIYLINYYYLIPKLLYKRRFQGLIYATILTIVVGSAFCTSATLFSLSLYNNWPDFGKAVRLFETDSNQKVFLTYFFIFFWNSLLVIFTNSAIRIFFSKKKIEKQLIVEENERLEAELAFLKNQMNPDFLINMLEILKGKVSKESPEVKDAVETFTNLLHYQIFECRNDEIDVEKELLYVKSYINVQSGRMEKESDIKLHIAENIAGFKIAPLLIIPLLENAFKHISHYSDASENKIHIKIEHPKDNELEISVENTFEDKAKLAFSSKSSGGVGLANLKRRLELIYPGRFNFNTSEKDRIFSAKLSLHL